MRKNLTTLLVVALLVIVIGSMMCAFQVRFTETAVVTRWKRVIKEIEPGQAGLYFKAPWPIDEVYRYDTRLRSFETEFRQAATRDQKTVILTAYATWRIDDARKFLEAVGSEDTAGQKIRDMLENQVQLVLRDHDLDELVNTDPGKMKLAQIEEVILQGALTSAETMASAKTGIRGPAAEKYGIDVVSVGIKRLGLPESVTKDVFARMKEDRQREISQYQAEGDAEATKIRVTAEEISSRIQARAQAYAKTVVGQGDAEAAKYYKVFEENLELSNFLKKIEMVETIMKSGQITLVMDADKFIPLDILSELSKVAAEDAAPPGGSLRTPDATDSATANLNDDDQDEE